MNNKQDFNETVKIIREMIARFQKIEGRTWGAEGAVIELSKQVGELSALIMTREGYYFDGRSKLDPVKYGENDDRIADELFDILFCIVRISDHYGLSLEVAADKEQANNLEWFRSRGIDF